MTPERFSSSAAPGRAAGRSRRLSLWPIGSSVPSSTAWCGAGQERPAPRRTRLPGHCALTSSMNRSSGAVEGGRTTNRKETSTALCGGIHEGHYRPADGSRQSRPSVQHGGVPASASVGRNDWMSAVRRGDESSEVVTGFRLWSCRGSIPLGGTRPIARPRTTPHTLAKTSGCPEVFAFPAMPCVIVRRLAAPLVLRFLHRISPRPGRSSCR